MKTILFLSSLLFINQAAQATEAITPQENAICRKDAIRNCFFSLGSGEATRACLRKNVETLSPKCKALIKGRMKVK
jgi:hypothetical protein